MASMCAITQSPRAVNAFSSACAARTCPAPEEAESSNTRGLVFIRKARPCCGDAERCPNSRKSSCRLALTSGEFFEDAAGHLLDLAESSEVILEFGIHRLRFLRPQLNAHDHVPQLDGMRKQRIFLQFL